MKLINPSIEILSPIDGEQILKHLEFATRTCYNSFDKVCEGSDKKLLKVILESKHESCIEHISISIKVICSRACLAQWTRHRLMSFSVQSQRYINFKQTRHGGNVKFIRPVDYYDYTTEQRFIFNESCETMESLYFKRLEVGFKPEKARGVLGADSSTEMVVTANLRSWLDFLKKRTQKNAQDEIRFLANQILSEFKSKIPVIFDKIGEQLDT